MSRSRFVAVLALAALAAAPARADFLAPTSLTSVAELGPFNVSYAAVTPVQVGGGDGFLQEWQIVAAATFDVPAGFGPMALTGSITDLRHVVQTSPYTNYVSETVNVYLTTTPAASDPASLYTAWSNGTLLGSFVIDNGLPGYRAYYQYPWGPDFTLGLPGGLPQHFTVSFVYENGFGQTSVTGDLAAGVIPVPEPSSLVLVIVGLATAVGVRLRRRPSPKGGGAA
jgi:hypothetical protein